MEAFIEAKQLAETSATALGANAGTSKAVNKVAVRGYLSGLQGVIEKAPTLATYKTPIARIELGVWVLLDALGEATNRLNAKPEPVDTVAIKKSSTRAHTAESTLKDLEQTLASERETHLRVQAAYEKECKLRVSQTVKAAAAEERVTELETDKDSIRRKVEVMKKKYAATISRMEEELATAAKSTEQNRIRQNSHSSETLERRLAEQASNFKDKTRRAVEAAEGIWKMKVSQAEEDVATVEKRMAKAKLATASAHEAEIRAIKALDLAKTDLEAQRDETLKKLWRAEGELKTVSEKLEKESRLLKRSKVRAKRAGEATTVEQSKLQTELEEAVGQVATLEVELKTTKSKLEVAIAKQDSEMNARLKSESAAELAAAAHKGAVAVLDAEMLTLEESRDRTSASLAEAIAAIEQEEGDKKKAVSDLDVVQNAASAAEEKLVAEVTALKDFLTEAQKARDDARDDFKREQGLLEEANAKLGQGESDIANAANYVEKWHAKEAELSDTVGELKGTQVQLEDTKSLLETTQTHALDIQQKLSQAMTELDRLKQQATAVDKLKSNLALAYSDLESCKEKFAGALTDFNTSTAAANSLHMFEF